MNTNPRKLQLHKPTANRRVDTKRAIDSDATTRTYARFVHRREDYSTGPCNHYKPARCTNMLSRTTYWWQKQATPTNCKSEQKWRKGDKTKMRQKKCDEYQSGPWVKGEVVVLTFLACKRMPLFHLLTRTSGHFGKPLSFLAKGNYCWYFPSLHN